MTGARLEIDTVAVLGMGIIGGSLLRALSAREPELRRVGWSPALGERMEALESGVVTDAPSAWEDAVAEAELVVLAMPLEACLRVLEDLEGLTSPTTTLTDVVSLKAPVRRVAVRSGVARRWVGAHPMAGSEKSGFSGSRADLFEDATIWITHAGADPAHVDRVRALWELVGGRPRETDDEAHDRAMALVSHLPQLVASALGAELAARDVAEAEMGPGGRDTTRLAASAPGMWTDLFRHAPPELADGLRGVSTRLHRAADALEGGRVEELEELMRTSRAWRTEA